MPETPYRLPAGLSEFGWDGFISQPETTFPFLGGDAIEKLVRDYDFETILDIGCWHGAQTRNLRGRGKRVTALDIGRHPQFEPDILGDYMQVEFPEKFDAIWCCHVLEHQRNFGSFIEKLYADLKDDGILALTVPPGKHAIVSEHVTLWTPGLLLYNLVLSGFDCRSAAVKCYGYNISVIVRKKPTGMSGQLLIPELAKFFPFEVDQGFEGRFNSVNW